jgi:hypothetical protein
MKMPRLITFVAILAAIAALGLGAASTMVGAQDATETPATVVTHPSHVHVGPCSDPDPNPAFPLNNVGPRTDDDGNAPDPEDIRGSLSSNAVEIAESEIEVKLDDLLTEAHSIIVHESDQNMSVYIACADIGGPVLDDKLYVGLGQLNDSGYSGIAELESDGDNTNVKIYLVRSADMAAPDATPEA